MFPEGWAPPCGTSCTKKYAALLQIPWRVFCKKGCDNDGETWDECIEECNELCYKDPVLKDHEWSSYIDRSPGQDNYSLKSEIHACEYSGLKVTWDLLDMECFHACVSGCSFKLDIPTDKAEAVQPNRPPKPTDIPKPKPPVSSVKSAPDNDDLPCISA